MKENRYYTTVRGTFRVNLVHLAGIEVFPFSRSPFSHAKRILRGESILIIETEKKNVRHSITSLHNISNNKNVPICLLCVLKRDIRCSGA